MTTNSAHEFIPYDNNLIMFIFYYTYVYVYVRVIYFQGFEQNSLRAALINIA